MSTVHFLLMENHPSVILNGTPGISFREFLDGGNKIRQLCRSTRAFANKNPCDRHSQHAEHTPFKEAHTPTSNRPSLHAGWNVQQVLSVAMSDGPASSTGALRIRRDDDTDAACALSRSKCVVCSISSLIKMDQTRGLRITLRLPA